MKTNAYNNIFLFGLVVLISVASYGQRSNKNNDKMKLNPEEVFEKRDTNEDGKLEKSELIGFISNDFDKVDTDQDGFLSLEEFKEAPKFKKRERGQNRRGQRGNRPSVDELFAKMDTNEDGKLSKDEAKGPLSKHFDRVDSDEDGFITKEEIENAPKPGKGQRQRRH